MAVAGWRQDVFQVDYVSRPEEYIFPLDCSKHAYERCCTGYSFRVRLALSRKLRSAACIDVHHREGWSANVLNSAHKIAVWAAEGAPRIPRVNSEKNCGGWPCIVVASLSQRFVIGSAVRIAFAKSLGFTAEFRSTGNRTRKPAIDVGQLLITTL